MLAEIMKDRNLKIIFGLLSTLLFIGLLYKLTKVPGGMILPGYFLGGIILIGVIMISLIVAAISKQIFRSFSFLTLFAITSTIAFIGFHYYLYSPTLKIIVPNGYTGTINLVLSNADDNVLTVDSNGIGYLNKWTFEKTYSKPIVQQIDGQNLDSNCVGFNPSTFWGYSKFCCVNGKTIKSLSFELERKNDGGQNQFRAKGFSQYVDTKKLY
ncbi:hypothetical protein FW778_22295 [Ginsengibacter hankyongi]|uniref:Uncharacterized protein n=1 Tax=Ginsengibacter hankyongi TaxID=2607284 RepID=A0A5J5IAW8_9BACT|nr:hypothetical protein [Ginsengibacter hankyongi]KAA9034570.1 hypothetical protein FW778_22295 [Ginsengibacter hankyongi]